MRSVTIVDSLLPQQDALALHTAAKALFEQGTWMLTYSVLPVTHQHIGAMRAAASLGADTDAVGFTDRTARGDCIMFLHPDDPPASVPPWIDAVNALAALQHALAKVLDRCR